MDVFDLRPGQARGFFARIRVARMLASNMAHVHPSPPQAPTATHRLGPARRSPLRQIATGLTILASAAVVGLAAPNEAAASPGVDGTRNLSMGNATRGSSTGTDAALINPAGLGYSQQFEVEPIYQFNLQTRTHGLGIFVADSLNSPRIALALGYVFLRGTPRIRYDDITGERESLELVHFGHQVSGTLTVIAVKNWLYLGFTPKWQYISMRYLDPEGVALDYRPKHNAFGLDVALALNILDWAKVAVVGYNLFGPNAPARTDDPVTEVEGFEAGVDVAAEPNYNDENIRRVADYQRSLGHGLAIFPLRRPEFSLNVDATYDFTSYWTDEDKFTRVTVNGGAEFVAGPVPIRVGGWWDSRGRGGGDDRGYVSAGLGFIKPAALGGVGVDVGVGFAQQVAGAASPSQLDTILSVNIGLRLRPDL